MTEKVEEYLEDRFCKNVCTCDEVEECKKGIRIKCTPFNCRKNLIVGFVELLEKENAELKSIAEHQQSSNMRRYFEIQKLKKENSELKVQLGRLQDDCKAYNYSQHTYQERIADLEKENAELKLRNQELLESCEGATMMYKDLQKAKEHIKKLLDCLKQDTNDPQTNYYVRQYIDKAEQFLKGVSK